MLKEWSWDGTDKRYFICFCCRKLDVCLDLYKIWHNIYRWNVKRYHTNPGLDHHKAAKKVLKYLQGTKIYILMYKQSNNLKVIGYFDSDFAGCVDLRKSTTRYIFIPDDGAISWRNPKQIRITIFIIKAKFVSCFKATLHGIRLKSFIFELRILDFIDNSLKIILW